MHSGEDEAFRRGLDDARSLNPVWREAERLREFAETPQYKRADRYGNALAYAERFNRADLSLCLEVREALLQFDVDRYVEVLDHDVATHPHSVREFWSEPQRDARRKLRSLLVAIQCPPRPPWNSRSFWCGASVAAAVGFGIAHLGVLCVLAVLAASVAAASAHFAHEASGRMKS